ncbi:putative serine/threonine-protein kinase [Streptomyces sp. NBRC 110611]|uniref:serine/threonine-protein kinase n=1 Tax=Streptomyces sp. NBRC 110611 TaxID=1621259 RepID=UPI00082E31BD|nr:serine/threonine-protein kinase [Streptomyces sp. NBRC 110611]GAU66830.1 putative serine/threonine-protein kinase [Streptomyces sp. NBRC 110611]
MSEVGRLVAGRYRLVEHVGRGGMGTVWRAEDEVLGRQVAVKKLHVQPHLQDDDIQRLYERTRREARSAARITHPNVIVVHDVVDDEGLPCIVMEYIPSVTLSDVLKRQGTLPPREAARIGASMAAALRAAHDAGVLHRDIKPANVLLGQDGRIVLTDFGIAVQPGTPSLTKTGELVGSIHYLAPERLRSNVAEPGPASDLWSLGAALYEAVEGRHPFQRDTAIETAYAIATEAHDPPRNAGDLIPVIQGLLAKDPGQRMDVRETERLLSRAAASIGPAGTAPVDPMRTIDATGTIDPTGVIAPAGKNTKNSKNAKNAKSAKNTPADATTRLEQMRATKASASPASPISPAPASPTSASPARRGGRGRRTALWVVSAVVVAATATGGVLLWPWDGGDAVRTHPAPSGASSDRPSSSPAPPTPSFSPSPVPAGYQLKKAGQGFSVPVRDGWTAKKLRGGELGYIDPTGLVSLRVDVVEFGGTDPVRHWRETEEDQTRRDCPGYERVRMHNMTFRGRPAGYWEFTFKGRVRDYRAVEVAFSGENGAQYVVYLSAPDAQWHKYRPDFDAAVNGIRLGE